MATWRKFPDANVVVHLAARSFVPDSWNQPAEYLHTNLLGTVQALEFCRLSGARLVFLSSYMYGATESIPIPETAELAVRSPYALSKMFAEKACQFYLENLGTKVTILRPFNVYGAGQIDTFLVPWIINQVRSGGTIHVKDLEPRRDYIYIKDLVTAIICAINQNTSGGVFNIGSGSSYSVAELIATIQRLLSTTRPVISSTERRPGEIMNTVADITAAARGLGWAPHFSLQDGLIDMLGLA